MTGGIIKSRAGQMVDTTALEHCTGSIGALVDGGHHWSDGSNKPTMSFSTWILYLDFASSHSVENSISILLWSGAGTIFKITMASLRMASLDVWDNSPF